MYKMIHFYMTGSFDLYMERVMAFDEWDTHYPIINNQNVQYPDQELRPEFYTHKKLTRY